MADNTQKPKKGLGSRALKLLGIILVVLLIPMTMDQLEVDREQVKVVGRVAAGGAGILFLYGVFTKLLKVMAFVVLLLIGGVVLVCERQIEMPRLKALWAERAENKGK